MNEDIDQTQWLPRGSAVILPERNAKGDIDGNIHDGRIVSARCKDETILHWLMEKGFIEPYHEEYAVTFMELRNAWLKPNAYRENAIYRDILRGMLMNGSAGVIYDDICNQLDRWAIASIIHACTTPTQGMRAEAAVEYQKVFERLKEAIEEVRKQKVME